MGRSVGQLGQLGRLRMARSVGWLIVLQLGWLACRFVGCLGWGELSGCILYRGSIDLSVGQSVGRLVCCRLVGRSVGW